VPEGWCDREVKQTSPWDPETVDAVARHMNVDHGEDNVLIVQALGGFPQAVEARMKGMSPAGVSYAVLDGDLTAVTVVVPWLAVPTDRAEVRAQVVALHAAAVG
jgi:hypothetical protein